MEDKHEHPELGKDGIPIRKDCANGTCNCKPDPQPNDVEAVKPIGDVHDFGYGKYYSQQTVDQLQEKIAKLEKDRDEWKQATMDGIYIIKKQLQPKLTDTESKLKVAEEALEEIIKNIDIHSPEDTTDIAQSALANIRKESRDESV